MAGSTGEQDWYVSGVFNMSFLNLNDTFGDYVDRAGKVPKVNSAEDALVPSDFHVDDVLEYGGVVDLSSRYSSLQAAIEAQDGKAVRLLVLDSDTVSFLASGDYTGLTVEVQSGVTVISSAFPLDFNIVVHDGGQWMFDVDTTVNGNLESKSNTSGIMAFDAVDGDETLTYNGSKAPAGLWQCFGSGLGVAGSPKIPFLHRDWFEDVSSNNTGIPARFYQTTQNVSLTVGTDTGSIQEALDQIPKYCLHDVEINVPSGTYNEDLVVPEVYTPKRSLLLDSSWVQIYGNQTTPSNVEVNSVFFAGGNTDRMAFKGFRLIEDGPYADVGSSLEARHNVTVVIADIEYRSIGDANRAVCAYGGTITLKGSHDFDNKRYDQAIVAKEFGSIAAVGAMSGTAYGAYNCQEGSAITIGGTNNLSTYSSYGYNYSNRGVILSTDAKTATGSNPHQIIKDSDFEKSRAYMLAEYSLSGVSTVTFEGFTDDFNSFLVTLEELAFSDDGSKLRFEIMSGGSRLSVAANVEYHTKERLPDGTENIKSETTAAGNGQFIPTNGVGNAASEYMDIAIEVKGARNTGLAELFRWYGIYVDLDSIMVEFTGGGQYTDPVIMDGMFFTSDTGTFSGILKVWGINRL